MARVIDPTFTRLRLDRLSCSALERARRLGVHDASVHVIRTRTARFRLHDARVTASTDTVDCALGVRVIHDGTIGYASTDQLTTRDAAEATERAVHLAKRCRLLRGTPAVLVAEPVHGEQVWISAYELDPFDIPAEDRVETFARWSSRLLASPSVTHASAMFVAVRENHHYADMSGSTITQQRVRVHPMLTVFGTDRRGEIASIRSSAPPTGRGWEYLTGAGWDWERELERLPDYLATKLDAVPVRPGTYDLVIEPSNLWLTLHETIGHATELDRALGHEAAYAGTTFVRPDRVGAQRLGAPSMNVSADRTRHHGLATVGFDDEGVAAQSWPLVTHGLLVGLQTDRRSACAIGASRSTGCSFAESALLAPISRMPNVSLEPATDGPETSELIAGVEDGIYIDGAAGFSIDTRREDFEFTAQRCHRIRAGRLAEPLSDVAYGGTTTRFWSSLSAVGGPTTFEVFGADMCGKGQPVQSAATSHGCPATVFDGIAVHRAGAR